ncbi:MAG: hypothetical protein LBS62_04185 [Clostridiales bacterium]|jgi:hypothetical protein|nr:hypothetical protein [Clostridiales bacterium]
MNHPVFGEITFNHGWDGKATITLWGRQYNIVYTAAAYFKKDGITAEQERAFTAFQSDKVARLAQVETLLQRYISGADPKEPTSGRARLTPRSLLFERDGGYALLLDDADNPDNGLAVRLHPDERVMTQDEYL